MRCLLCAVLLSGSLLWCQEFLPADTKKPAVPAQPIRELTEEQKNSVAVLASAETEATSMSPGLRVYALVRIADGYFRVDKTKAVNLLSSAFGLANGEEDREIRWSLQTAIVQRLFSWSPETAAKLWEMAEAEVRERTADPMLKFRLEKKDFAGATDVVLKTMTAERFPYSIAARVMARLPEEMVVERQQLFMAAFDFARLHPRDSHVQFEDFGTMLLRSWKGMPSKLVLEGVDLLLDQARRGQAESLIIGSGQKSTRFDTTYEYRVYQMLPILRTLDRDRADSALKTLSSVSQADKANPYGFLPALGPQDENRGDGPRAISFITYSTPSGTEEAVRTDTISQDVNQRIDEIRRWANQKPREALSMAATLPEIAAMGQLGFLPRLTALTAVAQITQGPAPDVARSALDAIYRNLSRVPSGMQERFLDTAIKVAGRLEDRERLATGIRRGLQSAELLYKDDTDNEDPNQEMKAFWPSAAAWQKYIFLERKYLPEAVPDDLEAIKDEEIRSLSRIAVALASLGHEEMRVGSRVKKKNRTQTHNALL